MERGEKGECPCRVRKIRRCQKIQPTVSKGRTSEASPVRKTNGRERREVRDKREERKEVPPGRRSAEFAPRRPLLGESRGS